MLLEAFTVITFVCKQQIYHEATGGCVAAVSQLKCCVFSLATKRSYRCLVVSVGRNAACDPHYN